MEFLVRIRVDWPDEMDPSTKAQLVASEAQRAGELAAAGTVIRLWRVPGDARNWGLWAAPGVDALQAAIASLPVFPWLDAEITPLDKHPSDPGTPN